MGVQEVLSVHKEIKLSYVKPHQKNKYSTVKQQAHSKCEHIGPLKQDKKQYLKSEKQQYFTL